MKTPGSIEKLMLKTIDDSKLIFVRLIVGLIFISEGIQKFLVVTMIGPAYFEEIGFINPMFWAYFTGTFELICGLLVLLGLLTRLASIPLMIVMITAFITTKLPVLNDKGFLSFLHEYRIDFALTLLLVMLIIYGGGKWSADLRILRSTKSQV